TAEWVLKNNGDVVLSVGAKQINVTPDEKLPDQPFKLVWVLFIHPGWPSEEAIVDNLGGLPGLERLSLSVVPLTDAGLDRLSSTPLARGLEHLGVYGTRLTDAGLTPLKRFMKLREVDVIHRQNPSTAWLKQLRELPALTALNLTGCPSTDDTLRELRGLKLQSLVVGGKGITDVGLDHLRGMSELTFLNLDGT